MSVVWDALCCFLRSEDQLGSLFRGDAVLWRCDSHHSSKSTDDTVFRIRITVDPRRETLFATRTKKKKVNIEMNQYIYIIH